MGKETDIGEKLYNIVSGIDFLLIDIYGVTKGLECIETNTYRKYDVECHLVKM